MAHGVEGEEVVFTNAIRLAQELEAGFENAGFGVLEGNANAKHGAAVLVVEIDSLGDLTTGDAKQDRAAAVTTCSAIGFERQGRFLAVGGFDKDEFEFPDFI